MNRDEILIELRELSVAKAPQAQLPGREDFADAVISQTLGLDSLDLVRFVVALERHFNVELSDAALVHVKTFGDLARSIAGELSPEPTAADA